MSNRPGLAEPEVTLTAFRPAQAPLNAVRPFHALLDTAQNSPSFCLSDIMLPGWCSPLHGRHLAILDLKARKHTIAIEQVLHHGLKVPHTISHIRASEPLWHAAGDLQLHWSFLQQL